MEETLTIQQLEDTYIEDLNMLGDWFMQYEYLLEISLSCRKSRRRTVRKKIKYMDASLACG